ncbi:hypothetical protein Syun_010279 [Stephania yunnanensis]|uniref:Uncharacterized protein n=1 Tax=Stephania yunnanensis TaxID=152371 RepID=A0AAP0KH68_9MAGN
MTGTLSPDMCQLTGMWYSDERGNNLNGSIPDSIGNCTSFKILDVSYNQLTGDIPYNTRFLQVATLSLQGNRLTGKIPEVINLMQALAVLDLSENELIVTILAELGTLEELLELHLANNYLEAFREFDVSESFIKQFQRWWKHMDVSLKKLPFARDRLVECYFWILGVYFEPCYSWARVFTTTVMALASIINDIYDVNGTMEELLLFACAFERMDDFENLTEQARGVVSICGEPIQRLGAYMIEGLIARKEESGGNIYRSLRCKEPESKDLLSYMQILYEVCPYLKFGYMAANGAIAEAFKNEDQVHIVDFRIAQGTQWMTLLQALSARPIGPPRVRITGIDDPVSKYARGDTLELVGKRLAAMSEKFKIPIEFQAVPVFVPDVTREMLDVRPGEALAVNFPLMLHHTPDESVDINNPRDGLLRMVKSLSPKVVTLVEQESNTNTTSFFKRFVETLEFYSAMFESIDGTMPRDKRERINVEQHCLARDIVNIIACEGNERVERHELLGKWKSRFSMAGFQPFPLSSHVNSVIKSLLRCYSDHYTLLEKDGGMLLGWKDRNLISASAWH